MARAGQGQQVMDEQSSGTICARRVRDERPIVACSLTRGIHRWAEPFSDGDTCACGALYLFASPPGSACFEVQDV